MKVHAREPFSTGLTGPGQVPRFQRARCGPLGQGDEVVDTVILGNLAKVTCEKCMAILAREDDRAPMGDGSPP